MRLRARETTDVANRLAVSASVTDDGAMHPTDDILAWLQERGSAHRFAVERVPFADLRGWSFAPNGNLVHDSGRFFSIEGLHIVSGEQPFPEWYQPIIVQPEIGILGILAKEFDGVLHFLMQAKMEPGNVNLLQLSPTVQATRSNYTGVHRGAKVKHLEHFTAPPPGGVLVDVLQSEHGAWFFHKSNRNMIVETDAEIPADDDFRWLTLGQIGQLLARDNLVNMDSRTVLACAPMYRPDPIAALPDAEFGSWFTAEQSRHDVRAGIIPLTGVAGWKIGPWSIDHEQGRYFRVMGVRVEAGNREVTGWTQPLLEPLGSPVAAFLTRRFSGVPHVLVNARVEGGLLRNVELAPTVQCTPEFHAHLESADRPRFLTTVLNAPPEAIRYETTQSEEGGRFFHPESRYLVVEATEEQAPTVPPRGYQWATQGQLNSLARHGNYLNVQARTLLSVLNAHTVEL
jgi:oxidase EvaA